MEDQVDEVTRRSLVVAIISYVAYYMFGIEEWVFQRIRWAQGRQARPHIKTASDYLEENYTLFSKEDLTTPRQLYRLNTDQIRENLVRAEEAKSRAVDNNGLPLFNQETTTAIREVEEYINFQRGLLKVFDISGSVEGNRIQDEYLGLILTEVKEDGQPDSLPASPYEVSQRSEYTEQAVGELKFIHLNEYMSHTPEKMITVAEEGFESLEMLQTLYKKLYSHTSISDIHHLIIDIDQDLAQTTTLQTTADEAGQSLERLLIAAEFGSLDPLPDTFTDYYLNSSDITIADVERSYEAFSDSFGLFSYSLERNSENKHKDASSLWTDGLTAMFEAHQVSPFYHK